MPALFWQNLAALGYALGALMALTISLHVQERALSGFVAKRLGWRAMYFTGWLGVPIHELSHIVVAKLCRHRIVAWRLFDPDPRSGTLGYVHHGCSQPTLWQRAGFFFVAVAPLLGGALSLWGILWWIVESPGIENLCEVAAATKPFDPHRFGRADLLAQAHGAKAFVQALLTALWQHRSAYLPLQLYLAACIACHLAPSRADFSTAGVGVIAFCGFLLAGTAASAWLELPFAAVRGAIPFAIAIYLVASLFQALYAAMVALLAALWTSVHRRPATA